MELGTQIADGLMRRTAKALCIATLSRGTFFVTARGQARFWILGW